MPDNKQLKRLTKAGFPNWLIGKKAVTVWNEWRSANLTIPINLGNADLRGADLNGADLNGADLGWANLSGANLSGATLRGADISGATLHGPKVKDAIW